MKVHGTSVTQNGAGRMCREVPQAGRLRGVPHGPQGRSGLPQGRGLRQGAWCRSSASTRRCTRRTRRVCTYCHAGDAGDLPNSAFCKGCHKVDMPHPAGFGLKDPSARRRRRTRARTRRRSPRVKPTGATCLKCHEVCLLQRVPPPGSVPTSRGCATTPTWSRRSGAERVLRVPQGDVLLQLPREPGEAGPAQVASSSSSTDWRGTRPRGRALFFVAAAGDCGIVARCLRERRFLRS